MNFALSYVKLQEVYASEQNKVGSWVSIGYKDPSGSSTGGNTTNFTYANDSTNAATLAWKATTRVGLNDCQTGTVWAVGSGCTVDGLTPNFCKIGQATSCGTVSAAN